jgi:PAS domain S-box-containing protein
MATHPVPATMSSAPGEQIFQPAPSLDAAGLVTTRESAERQEWLQEIADALRANLARGYLESEEQFRQIAEAMNDIVSLTDTDSRKVLFVNAAYERIWGRAREDLYENPLAFLKGVHPDDRARVREAIVTGRRQAYDLEFRVLRPGGDQRWVWSRGFPVRNADGEIYRTASITEDVTDRKHVVESHERLIRGFTHDVKNPLGAADGYLSLLEDGVFGTMSAAQTESIAHARRCIRTALTLVSQLLEIERA